MGTGVLLSCPGTLYSRQTALAYQEAGILERYVTGAYFRSGPLARAALGVLPADAREKVAARLARRRLEELDDRRVTSRLVLEQLFWLKHRLPGLRRLPWPPASAYDRLADRMTARLVGPGLILVHGFTGGCEATFAAARAIGIPCVLDSPAAHHREVARVMSEERTRHPECADGMWHGRLDPREASHRDAELGAASMVLVGSSYSRAAAVRSGVPPAKLRVLPYGVDHRVFARAPMPGDIRRRLRLVVVGRVTQEKGLLYLFAALRRLGPCRPSLVLVGRVEGSGRWLAPHRDLFSHVPHTTPAGVAAELRRAHALVLPSLSEGFGLVLLEAMAVGRPVIATEASAAPDLVEEGREGFVVATRDPEALAARIDWLASRPAGAALMGEAAAARAARFTWERYRRALVTTVLEVVDGAREGGPEAMRVGGWS